MTKYPESDYQEVKYAAHTYLDEAYHDRHHRVDGGEEGGKSLGEVGVGEEEQLVNVPTQCEHFQGPARWPLIENLDSAMPG